MNTILDTPLNDQTFLFLTIQCSMSNLSAHSLKVKQFSLNNVKSQTVFFRSNDNEEVLGIPRSSSITGALPSYFFVSYAGHLLGESYPSAEMRLVYSAAPADWANNNNDNIKSNYDHSHTVT